MDAIHPDDREASARRYREAVEQGVLLQQEHRIRRHDGEYRWFVVNAFPLKDESGKVVKMYGAATDIHEQQVAMAALRESEERFRTLANTVPALIWYNDAQGNNLFINQYFLDFTGKSAEQIRGEGWHNLVHPEDTELYIADYLAAVREQRSWHNRNRIRRHDGVWRWHDNYAQPLFSSDGVYLGHVGVNAASDIIYEMSADWREMRFLKGKEFIATTENVRSDWMEAYIPETDKPRVWAAINRAIATRSNFELEHRVIRLDGTVGWTFSRAIGLMNETGEIIKWFGAASDITDRKHAEDALRESEAKYRSLFNSMDEGYAVVEVLADDNGEWNDFLFLEVNPAFEQQTGMVNSVGRKATEILGTPNPAWAKIYGRVAQTGEPVRFEQQEETLDRIFDLYAFRLGEAGSRRVAVLFTDITQRKRTEAALRKSEQHLRLVMQSAGIYLWELDVASGTVTFSENVNAITGFPIAQKSSEVMARLDQMIVPEDRERQREATLRAMRGEVEFHEVTRVINPDSGETIWLEGHGAAILDPDGKPQRLVGVGMNISDRKRAEEQLRQSEEKYRTLFDSINEGFAIVEMIRDASGKAVDLLFVEVNRAFGRHTGLENVRGRLRSETDAKTDDYWLEAFDNVARTGKPQRIENYNRHIGRWYRAYVSRVSGDGSRQVAVVFDDITKRKKQKKPCVKAKKERLTCSGSVMPYVHFQTRLRSNRKL